MYNSRKQQKLKNKEEDGNYIEINFFMLAYDSEEVVAMMETFTFEEGAYDKNYDFNMALME